MNKPTLLPEQPIEENEMILIKDRAQIFKLSEQDPVVFYALQFHIEGIATFEEALMTALNTLQKQNIQLRKLSEHLATHQAPWPMQPRSDPE